jgi:orotidine-5'-phosphate decarboxylase
MDFVHISSEIKRKKSFLCVGLDTDTAKLPASCLKAEDPVFEFNKQIVDHTHDLAIAYKPNIAFYECLGAKGWETLEKTANYIKTNYPEIFLIADAKRGDIGNTSKMYAQAFLANMPFDSITVAPYMGEDSVTPFLSYEGKWVILLALTSNKGAFDFQFEANADSKKLYEKVLTKSQEWADENRMMYVVGATKAEFLADIRKLVPNHFLLVPGVGAQGGSLAEVAKYGMNKDCGLIVNSSREILYASSGDDFAQASRLKAQAVQAEMAKLLSTIS